MREPRKNKKVRPIERPNVPKRVKPIFTNDSTYSEAIKIDKLDRSTFYKALRNACLINNYGYYGFPTPVEDYNTNDVGIKGHLVGYMLYYVRQMGLGDTDRRTIAHLIEVIKKSRLFDCPVFQKKGSTFSFGWINLSRKMEMGLAPEP